MGNRLTQVRLKKWVLKEYMCLRIAVQAKCAVECSMFLHCFECKLFVSWVTAMAYDL